jgi:hypothetical protein
LKHKWAVPFFFLSLILVLATLQACKTPTSPSSNQPVTCSNFGNDIPTTSAMTFDSLSAYDWVAFSSTWTYTGPANWAQSFNSMSVFASNSSPSPATLELAVYNQGASQQILADTTLTVPAGASQWFTVPLSGAVTDAGTVFLVAHALTAGLSIGATPNTLEVCSGSSGNSGYPLPNNLSLVSGTADCYAIYVPWCSQELTGSGGGDPCDNNPCYDTTCYNYDPSVCDADPCDSDPCYDTSCYNYDPSVCDTDPCDSDPCSDPSCPGYDPATCDPDPCDVDPCSDSSCPGYDPSVCGC